ncbi:Fic family protein [Yersinia ruckeri]|uniref:Fic family protein n=1 Tax=Yersinia ruckeri TaxID=29486 RepID=UPI002237FC84|nr:Fic family protein [Yersinia ruckeri]MCW6598861.1 Fic family protein [Yersinia ruckeri]
MSFNFKLFDIDKEQINSVNADKDKVLYLVKRNRDSIIYNIAALENSPYTYVEVKTLLEGITVGGHRLEDQQLILNQDEAWKHLLKCVNAKRITIDKDFFCELHALVAFKEALTWGEFRTGQVSIAGTDWTPPPADQLNEIYHDGALDILLMDYPILQAINFFLMGALNQFFFDGNKRTSRLLASGILLLNGYPALDIPASKQLEFNNLMIQFYNTQDGQPIGQFLFDLIKGLANQ